MDQEIRPLYEGARVVGRALTVEVPPGDELTLLTALEKHAKPGDVWWSLAKATRIWNMVEG